MGKLCPPICWEAAPADHSLALAVVATILVIAAVIAARRWLGH